MQKIAVSLKTVGITRPAFVASSRQARGAGAWHGLTLAMCLLCASAVAKDEMPPMALAGSGAPPVISGTVTIIGNVISGVNVGQPGKAFVTALDGPAEIKAAFAGIVKAWPANGLDAVAGRNIHNQFVNQLMYTVDGPVVSNLMSGAAWKGVIKSLTGTLSVRSNQVWFTCTSFSNAVFHYPDVMRMYTLDAPLHTSAVAPLELKAGAETVRCLHVDAGNFLMGQPWYMNGCTPWDPPHAVTFTKGFYASEAPITYELYNAVLPNALTVPTNRPPQCAANLSLVDARIFCDAFAKLTGRKVRLPSRAQLSYLMRCGTSNPPYGDKYLHNGSMIERPTPVKSSKPNAWGFYEWIGTYQYWEGTNDKQFVDSTDVVDPDYPSPNGKQWIMVGGWAIGEIEYTDGKAGDSRKTYARYRIVVEE